MLPKLLPVSDLLYLNDAVMMYMRDVRAPYGGFWGLGNGHTAQLSYRSHRGYKASNYGNSALFLKVFSCFFQFSLLQPLAV